MLNKVKELFSSIRFQQLVIAAIIIYLESGDWKAALITLLGGSVAVGTIDKAAKSIGGN